jgi:hypothetical protein
MPIWEVAGFFHSLRLSHLMNASSVDSVGSKRQEAEGGGVPREEAPPATLTNFFFRDFFLGLISKGRFTLGVRAGKTWGQL